MKKISCKRFNVAVRLLNGDVAAATILTEIEIILQDSIFLSLVRPSIYRIGILSSWLSLIYVQSLPGVTRIFLNISPRRSLIHLIRDFLGFYVIFRCLGSAGMVGGSSRRSGGGLVRRWWAMGGESGCGSWQREPVYRWGVEGGCREAEEEGLWARERSRGRRGCVMGLAAGGGEGRGE